MLRFPVVLLALLAQCAAGFIPAEQPCSRRKLQGYYGEHLGAHHESGEALLQHARPGSRNGDDMRRSAVEFERAEQEQAEEPSKDEFSEDQSLRAVAQEFAAELDPPGRIRAGLIYRRAREQCEWSTKSAADLPVEPCYRHISNATAFLGDGLELYSDNSRYMFCPKGRAAGLEVRTCHVSADAADAGTMSDDSFWRITRVGPFKGNGAQEWHIFRLKDAGGLTDELQQGSPLWITGKLFGVVMANGTMLPSPPIHIHHAHIQPDSIWQTSSDSMSTGTDDMTWWKGAAPTDGLRWTRSGHEVWYETHGDSACFDGDGGTDCLMETLPKGFGVQLPVSSGGLALDTDIVDMRPEGSEDMEFFIEMAIRWTKKPKKPLRRLQIHRPGRSRFATYELSKDSPTMNWGAAEVPHSGRFMYSYFHAHREFFDSFLVFAANPEELGIASTFSAAEWSRPERAFVLADHGLSIADMQASMFKSLAKSQIKCRIDGNCTHQPEVLCAFLNVGREPPQREGSEWDRYGVRSTDCNNLFVKKGAVITQVMFHPPARDPELNTAHNIFRSLFYMGGRDYGQNLMTAAMFDPLILSDSGQRKPWAFEH